MISAPSQSISAAAAPGARPVMKAAIVSRWSRADSVPCSATWCAISFIRVSRFMSISWVVVMTRGSTGAV